MTINQFWHDNSFGGWWCAAMPPPPPPITKDCVVSRAVYNNFALWYTSIMISLRQLCHVKCVSLVWTSYNDLYLIYDEPKIVPLNSTLLLFSIALHAQAQATDLVRIRRVTDGSGSITQQRQRIWHKNEMEWAIILDAVKQQVRNKRIPIIRSARRMVSLDGATYFILDESAGHA